MTTENTLRIGPWKVDWDFQPAPLLNMSEAEIKRLCNDPPVEIQISVDDQYSEVRAISTDALSLAALENTMPSVPAHLRNKSDLNPQQPAAAEIKHVILPPGPIEAYGPILRWIKSVIILGRMESFPLATATPLWTYKRVMDVARALKMNYLVTHMKGMIKDLLRVTPDEWFSLDLSDVLRVNDLEEDDDLLRLQVFTAIRKAKREGVLREVFEREYNEFIESHPACGLLSIEEQLGNHCG